LTKYSYGISKTLLIPFIIFICIILCGMEWSDYMNLGIAGEKLIKSYEGFPVNADGNPVGYLDSGGIPTIGWGHTGTVDGVAVYEGMVITVSKAQELFNSDVASAVNTINSLVTVPLTQAQFDALVSFCFNIGGTQFRSSTLLKKLNAGDYVGASNEFGRWVFDNGVRLQGLVDRREAEKNLFNSESYPEEPTEPTDPEEPDPTEPTPTPDPDNPPPYPKPDGEVWNAIIASSFNVNQVSTIQRSFLKTLNFGDNVKMKFTWNRGKNIGTSFTGKRLTIDTK